MQKPLVALAVWAALCAVGCAAKSGGSADGGAGSSDAAAAATDAPSVQGAGCAADPLTGVTLCQAVSLCPSILVDQRLFPGCGFRINGQAIDLQCACDGELCPIGTPTTCDQARKLLVEQSQPQICAQVNDGRCLSSQKPGTTAPSTCDRTCAQECGGSATCVKLCGC
jgi:hypothetical protein